MPLFDSMLYRHKVGHLKAPASGDTCGQTCHSRAISISSLSDGRHLSRVKSLAQGRDVRTVQLQQPHFLDILDCVNLIPVCGLQLLLLLLHLAREAGCQASIMSNSSGLFGTLIRAQPRPKIPLVPLLKVIKQLTGNASERKIKKRRITHQF